MAGLTSISVRAMIAFSGRDDQDELLAHVGLDPMSTTPTWVDEDRYLDVVERIVDDGDDDIQFRFAAGLDVDRYGAMGMAFKTAVDLRRSLERAARYTALIGESIHYELRPDDRGGAAFVLANRPARRRGLRISNEAGVASFLGLCRSVAATDTPLTPKSVSFSHGPPPNLEPARRFFGCSLSYGADIDALHLDAAFLDTPTRLGDEALSDFLSQQADDALDTALAERSIEARVKHVIANGLADGVPPMRIAARRLGMSERTLHRRLADEQLRYQDLVVTVRKDVATAQLTNTERPLVDIAFLTGFSDQSAFQRAFKRWTGQTPLAVRRG